MGKLLEQARKERYEKYLENIEIARREMETVKLYPVPTMKKLIISNIQ